MTHWPVSEKRLAKGIYWERSWNLVEGCTPVSPACRDCWAAEEAVRRAGNPNPKIRASGQGITNAAGDFNGTVRVREDRLKKPTPRQRPAVWPVWTDLFHKDVTDEFRLKAFATMEECKQHIFLVCTKRTDLLARFVCHAVAIPNIILMATVENQKQADKRIPELLDCSGKVDDWHLGLSIEPLLEAVKLPADFLQLRRRWVTCGGQSGPDARPSHLKWFQSLRDQCASAGVPFHFKSWGEYYTAKIFKDASFAGGEAFESPDGGTSSVNYCKRWPDGYGYYRAGKRRAGRLLDGKLHDAFPEMEVGK